MKQHSQAASIPFAAGEIFVSNQTSNVITVYSSTADGNVAPVGVAYLPSHDQLLVANAGSNVITFYPRTASGNQDVSSVSTVRTYDSAAPTRRL